MPQIKGKMLPIAAADDLANQATLAYSCSRLRERN